MSSAKRSAYLIGVGSNLSPRYHCEQIIRAVLHRFGSCSLSSLIHTEPDGVETPNHFINFMLYLETELSVTELKQWTNGLEEQLGRDRSHPDRKNIDRPADLDTLVEMPEGELWSAGDIRENYYRAIAAELAGWLSGQTPRSPGLPTCVLNFEGGLEVGDGATTIYLDRATGHIRVVQ
ncbi:2-amino-4-hydroxy-6-hydroxymethyldihydropteridine diphosphokinase [Aestuariirhabdus sp. Z084]|uniref:2-amino-4-hydroxy-6- hydroxymethyldihydropteridine diphosphokinase n=1 Tax=Aestuariirhabdus haliotis TaxID=2918751 RepID=UPI00201B3C71|nr:2-amino-4-hydroxy-6-hydroxymethyldihydropteridine diphosphokinase [Aestuariirhabdus haliotis]MCL6415416.1 2-amino-4-hydroxy-6-hydroxymethyldihydropteridine diphosphokinase [Aestuariirhabdus haliotis]MCL6419172.1 2-amino-4-hydroxy-6-hydroxymethyldihydropteridine diphosphokinase [Aestuariirhabdus haliotis]